MENASKALLMAGGVLIAIIIISLLVKTYSSIGAFQRQKVSAEEVARIEEFNKQFTKYKDQYVYGTEVITVINTIGNQKTKAYTIEAKIIFAGDYNYTKTIKEFGSERKVIITIPPGSDLKITNNDDGDDKDKVIVDSINDNDVSGLSGRAFKCTKIDYGPDGRVSYIEFTEKKYNTEE